MLFKQRFLEGIAAGKIDLAFRSWRRPTVKSGGTLLTPVGQLTIHAVEPIKMASLRKSDARRAGFESLEALVADIESQREGTPYRIRFELAGPDPRVNLRESAKLTVEERNVLQSKLDQLDRRSKVGPWTAKVLKLILSHPEQSAGELAGKSGYEKEWLKLNVRKLKNLGLTESLNPGYRLSPRGEEFLRRN